jgi:hypothetical protein
MTAIPPLPAARTKGQDGGRSTLRPRYEDISQDGRVHLTSLMPGLGSAVWHGLLRNVAGVEALFAQGVLPILSRLVIVGEDITTSASVAIQYEGSYRLAREKDGERLFLNMWVVARAPVTTTFAPTPPADAPLEVIGRLFAEHVITRPFAPPHERKVTRLDAPGMPAIPEDEHVFENAEALAASAGGPLEEAGDAVFGMMHTDSNQHVNSLVYPHIFEERLVRKLMHDARVPSANLLMSRALELRWRRPFFAGEHAKIRMRLLEPAVSPVPSKIGAIGAFYGESDKPSCALKMLFR